MTMTTLPCMFLSLVFMAPANHLLTTYSSASHGSVLRIGQMKGTESTPSKTAEAAM